MLSDKAIKEFQNIWKKEFGESISKDKAVERGTKLVNLFRVIYRPIPKDYEAENKDDSD